MQIEGPGWETLKNVVVDREGVSCCILRPSIRNVLHRMVCDVKLNEKVKIVTFRSASLVANQCKIPIEINLLNPATNMSVGTYKVGAGEQFAPPIFSSYYDHIQVRPWGIHISMSVSWAQYSNQKNRIWL
jgi:vacuolar protein sorting-associated protein 13A/C